MRPTPPPPPTPLRLAAVSKQLSGTDVLRDVGFSCPAGAITALLGPNGAGKTTTVTLVAGLRRPDTGRVAIFGRSPDTAAARSDFSLVPQEIAFPAPIRVARCLDFVEAHRPPSSFAPPRDELCERLGVTALLRRSLGGLSGGQQRRVALALGLLRVPGLLVLDEATVGLDEATRASAWALVTDYAERGGAVLVTSHILAEIEANAHRVIALSRGRVVLAEPVETVRSRLGGSRVTVRLPDPGVRRCLVGHIASAGLGSTERAGAGDGADVVSWRTTVPVALVAAIAAHPAEIRELTVTPIPLGELLDRLRDDACTEERV